MMSAIKLLLLLLLFLIFDWPRNIDDVRDGALNLYGIRSIKLFTHTNNSHI